MNDALVTICLCLACFWVGKQYAQIKFIVNLAKNPKRVREMLEEIEAINENIEKGMPEDAIEVETEKVGNVYYGYNKSTGKFLGQAESIHEVMVEAAKRFPGKNFWHPEIKEDSQSTCKS